MKLFALAFIKNSFAHYKKKRKLFSFHLQLCNFNQQTMARGGLNYISTLLCSFIPRDQMNLIKLLTSPKYPFQFGIFCVQDGQTLGFCYTSSARKLLELIFFSRWKITWVKLFFILTIFFPRRSIDFSNGIF